MAQLIGILVVVALVALLVAFVVGILAYIVAIVAIPSIAEWFSEEDEDGHIALVDKIDMMKRLEPDTRK